MGEDESSTLLMLALPCILPAVLDIFNYSLTAGVYPNLWKIAIRNPIPKIKCPSELRDYRPISILCAFSKAMERIVADQIKEYLEMSDVLDPSVCIQKRSLHSDNSSKSIGRREIGSRFKKGHNFCFF